MTQEEKQLLLKDLCARLPYDVKCNINGELCKVTRVDVECQQVYLKKDDEHRGTYSIARGDIIKPYLRPMSSMTEEEREHLQTLHNIISDENYGYGFSPAACEAILDFNNYCREHHLDNGGLITLGLALEATEGMYNTKT